MKTSTERARGWRVNHPDEYRKRQRELMAKRRGKVAPAAESAAVPVPISMTEPIPVPVVRDEPESVTAEVAPVKVPFGNTAKLATLLAAGKAAACGPKPEPEPEAESSSPLYADPPQGFDGWESYRRASWVNREWRDIPNNELKQETVDERLIECRLATGRRRL